MADYTHTLEPVLDEALLLDDEAACLDHAQVPLDEEAAAETWSNRPLPLLGYLALGTFLGVVFVRSQVVSWFRIQEMFRFDAFHMYGIIGSAVAVAALGVWLIKRYRLRTLHGEQIEIPDKEWGESRIPGGRYWIGGAFFGLGWALLGACPGPIFALLGGGVPVIAVALVAALAGTFTYGLLRPHLPH